MLISCFRVNRAALHGTPAANRDWPSPTPGGHSTVGDNPDARSRARDLLRPDRTRPAGSITGVPVKTRWINVATGQRAAPNGMAGRIERLHTVGSVATIGNPFAAPPGRQ